MSAARLTRNLQLGQGARCYEDVTADFTSSRDRKSFATKRLPCGPHGSLRSSFIVRQDQFVVLFASFWNSSISDWPTRLAASL